MNLTSARKEASYLNFKNQLEGSKRNNKKESIKLNSNKI